jgi:hypothetical protein
LTNLSYSELLGFLPDDPSNDTYVFAIREANALRLLCEDPSVFIHDDEFWHDVAADQEKGGSTPTSAVSNAHLSDWDLNCQANWISTQHRLSDEDTEKLRPWLAWIPIENVRKTLENTTQMAKAVTNYPMIRHLVSRSRS